MTYGYGGGGTRESRNCTHDIPQETVQNLGGHDFFGYLCFSLQFRRGFSSKG